MATYNGSKYLCNQIESILSQLDKYDELIIVDDHSSDDTVQIIKNFTDQRIKLFVNQKNIGVSHTFNEALMRSKGQLIFLSDQDDIWYPNKVEFVSKYFKQNNVDLLVHNARILDFKKKSTITLFELINNKDGLFRNIYSNTFTGCCMVFNRSVLNKSLPIPIKNGIYHDAWIGINAKLFLYRVIFIDKILIDYRRHSSNLSSMKRRKIKKIIPERLILIFYLTLFFLKKLADKR